jgi:hypothetical protein
MSSEPSDAAYRAAGRLIAASLIRLAECDAIAAEPDLEAR